MTRNPDRYYQSSGAIPLLAIGWMFFAGGIAASITSLLYSLLDHYNPFIYINFMAAAAFAAVTGFAVDWSGRRGKVRNRLAMMLAGFAMGLFAVYASWVWFLWILSGYQLFDLRPTTLLELWQMLGERGLWTLKSWKPTGGVLYAFWIAEAVGVLSIVVYCSLSNQAPFCEACDLWTEEGALHPTFNVIPRHDELKSALENEQYDFLRGLDRSAPSGMVFLRASLHHCPQCAESDYLTLRQIQIKLKADGEQDAENATDIVVNLRISRDLMQELSC